MYFVRYYLSNYAQCIFKPKSGNILLNLYFSMKFHKIKNTKNKYFSLTFFIVFVKNSLLLKLTKNTKKKNANGIRDNLLPPMN